MKKTIEQILNESLVGQSIWTYNGEIGIIKAVKINKVGGSKLGSFVLDVKGKMKSHTFRNWEIDFIDNTEQ